ncbi:uncharacterized protein TNCV_3044191 [Trichonephila clavipes]|nr:uncharacterized protein TNCV_3044191 [Trichonephila clavipes]
MDPMLLCPGKDLVLPTLNIDTVSALTRFLLISLANNDMSKISPFAIHKTLIGIGGEPKSVKRLRSGDLLIETTSALQTKSFLLAKSFLNNPERVSPHKTLNSCRDVISEPDLLGTPDSEILEGFSYQGVTQRFGHSQTSCRGQLTCSRGASVGYSSTDCTLGPKCVNCTQSHPSDSKLCPKWKLEKLIQEIKTNKNISYFEARKLIVPQLTQTYAQATKPSTISTTTQTDSNITNIICPPLQCLKPVSSENPMPSTSSSVSTVSTSSSSTQEHLLPSPSAIIPTIQSESLLKIPNSTTTTTTSPGNNLNTSVSSLETETRSLTTPNKFAALSTEIQLLVSLPESIPTTSNSEHSNAPEIPQCVKQNSRNRRKRPKLQKPEIEIKMAPHRPRKSAPTKYATDEEDMITYDVKEEELEPNPTVKFALKEGPTNYPKGYLRALTPTRLRKSRS